MSATKHIQLPERIEAWGMIPHMLNPNAEKPLWQQIHEGYAHGGGWNDFNGFDIKCDEDSGKYTMQYPGDPVYNEYDRIVIGDEMLVLFPYSWVLYVSVPEHSDKEPTHKVARLD